VAAKASQRQLNRAITTSGRVSSAAPPDITEFPMIGLVLVTHGRLADEFRAALEHVLGPQKQIEAITIGAEDDSGLCRSDIIEAVNRVDGGDGVAILTDMFGGTPSNLAISCMSRPNVEVLAGINLPMLVKLAKVREEQLLPDAIAMAQEAGRKYVTIASRVLAGYGRDACDDREL
jgi:PTS system mannose-specific IIA component